MVFDHESHQPVAVFVAAFQHGRLADVTWDEQVRHEHACEVGCGHEGGGFVSADDVEQVEQMSEESVVGIGQELQKKLECAQSFVV